VVADRAPDNVPIPALACSVTCSPSLQSLPLFSLQIFRVVPLSPPLFLYSWVFSTDGSVCSHLLSLVPHLRIFLPCRWRRYVPPKRRFTQYLHGATSQKTAFFKDPKVTFCKLFKAINRNTAIPQLTRRHCPCVALQSMTDLAMPCLLLRWSVADISLLLPVFSLRSVMWDLYGDITSSGAGFLGVLWFPPSVPTPRNYPFLLPVIRGYWYLAPKYQDTESQTKLIIIIIIIIIIMTIISLRLTSRHLPPLYLNGSTEQLAYCGIFARSENCGLRETCVVSESL
jgi:hypothetical protein